MPLIFNSMALYAHPHRKYLLLTELEELIPRLPCDHSPPAYFRGECLKVNEIPIDDQKSLRRMYKGLVDENLRNLIVKFESFERWVINSRDLLEEMHREGLSMGLLPEMYAGTSFGYLRKVVLSEAVKGVFCDIARSSLNSLYSTFPTQHPECTSLEEIEKAVLDFTHGLLDDLFSYSSHS
jgi:hypothetical protein